MLIRAYAGILRADLGTSRKEINPEKESWILTTKQWIHSFEVAQYSNDATCSVLDLPIYDHHCRLFHANPSSEEKGVFGSKEILNNQLLGLSPHRNDSSRRKLLENILLFFFFLLFNRFILKDQPMAHKQLGTPGKRGRFLNETNNLHFCVVLHSSRDRWSS